jgi:hypothetical protein
VYIYIYTIYTIYTIYSWTFTHTLTIYTLYTFDYILIIYVYCVYIYTIYTIYTIYSLTFTQTLTIYTLYTFDYILIIYVYCVYIYTIYSIYSLTFTQTLTIYTLYTFDYILIIAAEGSTPNLDMKVSRSLDPVFCADLCIGEIEILCLSRCRNSRGERRGEGECEKNIELRAHNLQAFYSGSENANTNTSRRNQVSMALFLCANIH